MIANNNIPESLQQLVKKVQENNSYRKALQIFQDQYNIHGTNVYFLTPEKVLQTYSTIKKKFYYERKSPANCSWFQNELRIYIWVLICYLYLNNKKIQNMTLDDWSFFKPIFYNRDPIIFQFQAILLLKIKASKWTEDQIKLLEKIVKIKTMKNKWNSIARQLYILSEKKFIKTPKQCRERWLNYLDPSKVHCPWTSQQDLILLLSIKENGKKWAFTVKKLLKKRTEHMVKNRFNSLINVEKKKVGNKSESQLLQSAIETAKQSNKSLGNIRKAQSIKLNFCENQQIDEEDSQSLFVLKKQKNTKKPKTKNKQTTKNKDLNEKLIYSIPTEINLQKKDIEPAEIINTNLQNMDDPISFFQEHLQDLRFNPFEDFIPDDSILVPDFFYPNDDDNHFHNQQLNFSKQDDVMDVEANNVFF